MSTAIWQEFIKIIKQELGSQMVETWLKAVTLVQWDAREQVVLLQTPNTFVKDWLATNYKTLFETHLARLFNVDFVKVTLLDAGTPASAVPAKYTPATQAPSYASTGLSSKSTYGFGGLTSPAKRLPTSKTHLNPSYTFDTFVVGPHNQLAYAAAEAIAEKPGHGYNPVFLYAESGLGKTHLLHAIGNAIKTNFAKMTVLYQTADRFVHEFINAIRYDQINQFQTKYKTVDVLLIDDIQCISNKEQTQEAFFHIFNALHDAHKQLVFSSDTYPAHINGITQRLRSRLEWGLIVDIQPPPIETKIAILKSKAALHHTLLSDEVAQFLAARPISHNIRALEGSLIQLIAVSSLTKQPITLELAKKVVLRTPAKETSQATPEFETIVKSVCDHYSFTMTDLRSARKSKQVARARQVAMYFMKKMTDKSLHEIGNFLGRKDHSTVIHALDKIQGEINASPSFSAQLLQLEDKILSA